MLDINDLIIDAVGMALIVGYVLLARLIWFDFKHNHRKNDGNTGKRV